MVRSSKSVSLSFLVLLVLSSGARCESLSLSKALELARDNNPQYLGAQATIAVARARHRQAVAQTLPQLSASASRNWNHRNYDTLAPLFPTPTEVSNYDAINDQVTLTQPLYKRAAYTTVSQSTAVIHQNEYELLATEQELLVKLVENWVDLIVAQDSALFVEAQVATTQRQLEQFQKALQLDLASMPELEDARAKHAQAVADKETAEFDIQEKLATLEELLGPLKPFSVPTLAADYSAPRPTAAELDELLQAAEEANPSVLAAQAALFAANKEVTKQRAGHEPTIDIVGNFGRNKQNAGNFPGQSGYDIHQRSIGLQVSVPLYSSGLQQARVGEALALRAKAVQDLEAATRTARTNARLAWYRYRTNSARVSASRQSLLSYDLALRTALSGAAKGLRYDVDVLRAKQDYLQAKRDLHKAQAEMIVDCLRLKAAIGTLTDADIVPIDEQTRARSSEEFQ